MYTINCNHNVTKPIARYDTVSFDLVCDWFNELSYIVQDVLTDDFFCFDFSRWSGDQERKAYEKAARAYNNLVPESEAIPLF